ncbi:very short patch repair endonuclease [Flavitalea sp. BT771]|uniref:very short patch repair endonuclease n=1 Tax=Flavitalea sp. BT771 TaxID=3063329 RepID=UPI0026E2BF8C|nr:very short patch repair endonuclease [Flavitalea sp. BT771]MDO6433079.1 very short patch repair endonuclease [Flavitalea sp. BT771]MDV6221645.1 very short patch repair endonuclease [Flavitalea sp. BT771]
MADVHDAVTRSYNMSRIKGKNTRPELVLRRILHAYGFRYRLHVAGLPGRPDIVMPAYRTAIFVHGCFWHGHQECRYFVIPKTRTEWWTDKINRNIANDKNATERLKKLGWKIVTIWECELKPDKIQKTLAKLFGNLQKRREA